MKTNFELFLPSIYGLISSLYFMYMLSNDVKLNTLTFAVYFANIFVTYVLYKVGGFVDRWLKQ